MYRGNRVTVVIPCLNERNGLRVVLEALPDCVDEVVVADNGSIDGSQQVASSLGALVVNQPIRGYGAAYQAGIPAATGDVIVTMDGDATYPTDQVCDLVDALLDLDADFVSGSRFPLLESMRLLNRVGNRVLTWTASALFRRRIVDSQSGMWAFRAEIYPLIAPDSMGMPFSQEIKLRAIAHPDVRFAETPIRYHDRVGEVKLRPWRDGFHNLRSLFSLRLAVGRESRDGRGLPEHVAD